ncbi:hypothetical protein C9374_003978 [Naegleria lovaniensis]|uniref:SAM domain-containing protein n=1 Tax=Naegleria lovaniensis TaxID=51637 RepID=A0AA88H100_NAELO|nr:uncharacterized protein C9374_003978 [Naegleria lovaniensis]KAG2394214.1 hypothetical protein C9374_003978 [Naegleria lovaniensis]
MKKFLKDFFAGSRSGDDQSHEVPPIEEWKKEHFVKWLHEKEFNDFIVESVRESSYFDEVVDFTKLTLHDLVVVLPNDSAVDVLNALAGDYPLLYESVKISNNFDNYLQSSDSVHVVRMDTMTQALQNLPKSNNVSNGKYQQRTSSSDLDFNNKNPSVATENNIITYEENKSSPRNSDEEDGSSPTSARITHSKHVEVNTALIENFLQRKRNIFTDKTISFSVVGKDANLAKDIEFPACHNENFSLALPKFTKLSAQEGHYVEKVIEKLKAMELNCSNDEEKIEEIAQNLAIPERFKYIYLNPENIDINALDSTSEKPYMTIQLLLNYRSDLKDEECPVGAFYFSVAIGLFCIEWNDQSVACVRRRDITNSEFIEIETIYTLYEIDALMTTVSKVCTEWNSTRKFDIKKCNQQHFVVDMLHRLNIMSVINHNRFYEATETKKKKRTKIKQAFAPYLNYGYFGTWISISASLWYKLLSESENNNISEELKQALLNAIFEEEIATPPTEIDLASIQNSISNDDKLVIICFPTPSCIKEFGTLTTNFGMKTETEPNFTLSLLRVFNKSMKAESSLVGDELSSNNMISIKPSCCLNGYTLSPPRR